MSETVRVRAVGADAIDVIAQECASAYYENLIKQPEARRPYEWQCLPDRYREGWRGVARLFEKMLLAGRITVEDR